MRRIVSKLKLLVGLSMALFLMSVVVPVVYAGVSWTGIDPIFKVNGNQFNVWIEWPSEVTCSIQGPVEVDVRAPKGASVELVSESSDDLGCGVETSTVTSIDSQGGDKVHVGATVNSDSDFPVNVKVYLNGELVRTYTGESDERVSGKPVALP